MSAKLINQSGTINLGYQVSIHTKGDYVAVHLEAIIPGSNEFLFLDAVTATSVRTNGIFEAMLRAEEKWGLELIKYQPEILSENG